MTEQTPQPETAGEPDEQATQLPHLAVAHPAVDGSDDAILQHETRSEVVHLSEARSDLLRRASGDGRRVVLVTDERSSLTYPMHDALVGTGGVWVVREDGGTLRDGTDGRVLTSVSAATDRTAPELTAPGAASPSGSAAAAVSSVFLRAQPTGDGPVAADVRRRLDAPLGRQLVVSVSVRHQARRSTLLGRTTEILAERLTGGPVLGWGVREPALVPWDRTALTAYTRGRMPEDARLVVVGDGFVGTVVVRRTSAGLEETTQLLVHAGPSGSDAARAVVDAVPATLEQLSSTLVPLFGLVTTRTGRADLLVPSVLETPVVPLAMLLGPPAVRELGLDLRLMADQHDAQVVGRRRVPGVVVPLGTFDHADWDRLAGVARTLGADRVLAAVGGEAPRATLQDALGEVQRASRR